LWFTPILWAFPAFLNSLKSEGVDTATIVRLTKFHELNVIRVIFRFFFVVPLAILGVDGVRAHTHINESMLWTDLLVMISGVGCCISSALTLVIFFPRSVEGEIAAKDAARASRRNRSYGGHPTSSFAPEVEMRYSQYTDNGTPSGQLLSSSKQRYSFPPSQDVRNSLDVKEWPYEGDVPEMHLQPALRPNRRRGEDIEMGGLTGLTEGNLSQHNLQRNGTGKLNPLVHNFTSPIDFYGGEPQPTRLTFSHA
jgi:hypothetical protein